MAKQGKISAVIPAWCEAESLGRVVAAVRKYVQEVIVVDDGSGDQTAAVARAAGAVVIRHLVNRGQGAALETGRRLALRRGADVIVHFDADDQFCAAEIPSVCLPIMAGEADIVFGSRFLGKPANIPWMKKMLLIPLAHLVNLLLFGRTLSDPQCGFRALSRRTAQAIVISQDGMAHCSEIIGLAFGGRWRIKEVAVTVHYHHYGQKFSGGVKIFSDLIKARLFNG
ncbi:glycosyltransferase family 2 protein [Candidatus Falkowbacteria bacterium CG_4_10_14_0_2_um_filter_48_10]|uniref:Family 2 glycosyl transferase n=1 Tax=Candidatus Falkowbacteria bacterium CG23_combo_of_CG06-09_8_20_14_all_49_15 TaxID=1974572 RepID=A0A2G9ZJP2_9BACT|nr:MAG: family 2 glycosyl transferase [Candidatus Falkowbacteria bacterium CG23_combo_of_CG06-09_8_20_14_all_49_15]PJA08217.1 MAG: glycosyltransferase family 2 protein [Candidatus Falkowbacteria bacterium CG_4_10_14_0_2_um_filter_48_10]